MKVTHEDFKKSEENNFIKKKNKEALLGLYLWRATGAFRELLGSVLPPTPTLRDMRLATLPRGPLFYLIFTSKTACVSFGS